MTTEIQRAASVPGSATVLGGAWIMGIGWVFLFFGSDIVSMFMFPIAGGPLINMHALFIALCMIITGAVFVVKGMVERLIHAVSTKA